MRAHVMSRYAIWSAWMVLLWGAATTAQAGERGLSSASALRVVYHLDDSARVVGAFRNMNNQLRAAPSTRIVAVALAGGVEALVAGAKDANGNPFEPMIDDLVAAGVVFRVCNNTLVAKQIDRSRLHPEAAIVESGVAEITRLQIEEGFAYIKP